MAARNIARVVKYVSVGAFVLAGCGGDFATNSRNDDGGAGTGGDGTGGKSTGGVPNTGGRATGGTRATGGIRSSGGAPATGGVPQAGGTPSSGGFVATGGTNATGGTPSTGGSPSTGGAPNTGGSIATGGLPGTGGALGTGGASGCQSLTLLRFVEGDFETNDPVDTAPGWEGAPNPPYYSTLSTAAARTGTRGVEFNDTGTGVPGIQQKIPVPPEAYGKTVTVTAWFRLVTFPSMRLLVEANTTAGIHVALPFADTEPSLSGFQKVAVLLTIPSNTDHLMIELISAVATADGVAYADDVQVCVDGRCSPCANPVP